MPDGAAEGIAIALLVAVLAFAIIRPRGLPEAVAAAPAGLVVCVAGLITWVEAWEQVKTMAPTVAFLAGVLMLSKLCEAEGMFTAAGAFMASRSRGRPVTLLGLVFAVSAVVTAVLSLDATVVLLTPVVFQTAARSGVRPKPHVYATAHLSNSGSLLLPVSNLTNLLAMSAAGLSFLQFGALMAAPWLVALAIEYVVFRRYFAADLSVAAEPDVHDDAPVRVPIFALVVVALTLVGFAVSSPLHVEPFWAALAGVAVLTVKRLVTAPSRRAGRRELVEVLRAANPWFLVFVLGLAMVVKAVIDHGMADFLRAFLPTHGDLLSLVIIACVAAILANIVNNLPAVLVLLPLVAEGGPIPILAVLLGVNIGPNLTYVGSLATLLWRRIVAANDHETDIADFTKLGLLTVPASLVLCTAALWGAAQLMGV